MLGRSMVAVCPDCGWWQRLPALPPRSEARCRRCDLPLARRGGRSIDAALACACAFLLLLVPAATLPLMRARLLGTELSATLLGAPAAILGDGWPLLALLVLLLTLAIPVARAGLLVAVLGRLRAGRPASWCGPAFRWAEELRPWSMPPVLLVAGTVAYLRMSAQVEVTIAAGGWCYAALALLGLVLDRSYDRRRVWSAIRPDPADDAVETGCDACGFPVPAATVGERCPRCGKRVRAGRVGAVPISGALLLAAAICYLPSYAYAMSVTVRPQGAVEHSIVSSILRLLGSAFWPLGVVILIASVVIPALKLAGLSWLLVRTRLPSRRGLRRRTRFHRFIDAINRWSFIDPFIIALNASLLAFPGVADVRVGRATLPFALVVTFTMLASRAFDPRLMWRRAEGLR